MILSNPQQMGNVPRLTRNLLMPDDTNPVPAGHERVTAKSPKLGRDITFDVPLPEDLGELSNMFGAAVVSDYFRRAYVIQLQNVARTGMESGLSDEAILKEVTEWRPGQKRERAQLSEFQKVQRMLEKGQLSAEDIKAILAGAEQSTQADNGDANGKKKAKAA